MQGEEGRGKGTGDGGRGTGDGGRGTGDGGRGTGDGGRGTGENMIPQSYRMRRKFLGKFFALLVAYD
jgi:hypothetical protein